LVHWLILKLENMKVNILLFGIAKDIVGNQKLELELKGKITVADFRKQLLEEYPELGSLNSLAIAINSEYARDSNLIMGNDEIALIPPVSGG